MSGSFTTPPHPGSRSAAASNRLSVLGRRDTRPELQVRRALHASGCRYRVGYPVPGNRRRSIDIAFPRLRLAVFIDGCFWHACPQHGTKPEANKAWWGIKLINNVNRDRDTDRILEEAGWRALRYWEHEDPREIARSVVDMVAQFYRGTQPGQWARP